MISDHHSAEFRVPPPLLFIATLLLGLVIGRMIGRPGIPFGRGVAYDSGMVSLLVGGAIMLSAIGLFREAGTDPKPGKPTTRLVIDGIYRRSRNPMYLGMALIYAGGALMLNSLAALLLLIPLMIVIEREVVEREEAYLEARFGERYNLYKSSVRRWL